MTGTDAERFRDPMGLYRLGYAGPLLEANAVRWEGGVWAAQHEQIVEETPVAIVYNRIPHVVMMATPTDLEDFALGFSLTEELIQSADDLRQLEISRYSRGVEILATVAERCASIIAAFGESPLPKALTNDRLNACSGACLHPCRCRNCHGSWFRMRSRLMRP